jgi:predicted acyltransferase
MMIAGSALYFSTYKRIDEGASYAELWPKVLKRSFLLLFFGIILICVHRGEMVFELWNVLCQLAFTTLITFALLRFSIPLQLAASLFLLLLSHSLYVFTDIPGYDQAYTPDKNFGSYIDMLFMGKLSSGHWIAMNAIPTAAHTIWGALIGRLIHRTSPPRTVLRTLIGLGLLGIIVGYGLDLAGLPIIKRTATLSFTVASAGWVTLMMALFYANWIHDDKPRFQTLVPQWLTKTTYVFVGFAAKLSQIPSDWAQVINAFVALAIVIKVASFLDSKKIYWKL